MILVGRGWVTPGGAQGLLSWLHTHESLLVGLGGPYGVRSFLCSQRGFHFPALRCPYQLWQMKLAEWDQIQLRFRVLPHDNTDVLLWTILKNPFHGDNRREWKNTAEEISRWSLLSLWIDLSCLSKTFERKGTRDISQKPQNSPLKFVSLSERSPNSPGQHIHLSLFA